MAPASIVVAAFAFAAVCLVVAVFALIYLGKLSIAQGRFDTDAQQRAVNLQRYIDQQVERRVIHGPRPYIDATTTSGAPRRSEPLPDQPPPTAQHRGRVDDVHEAEREEMRMRGESSDESVRDDFDEQPAPIVM